MRKTYHRKRVTKRGGFLPLLPLLAAGIPAILASVSGAMDIAHKAKQLKGSGARKRHYRKRTGRGVVSNFLRNIPLLGSVLGPLASNIGLGMTSRQLAYGRGLAVIRPRSLNACAGGRLRPYGKGGLLAPAGRGLRRGHYRYIKKKGAGVKRVHVRAHRVGGYTPYH